MNFEKITEYLDSLEALGIPSVDCIISRNHEIIYRHMNGTVDFEHKKPVSKDQLYIMFSMTKIQTMTAIMQLVEQGKISLEDEVSKYLPAYKNLLVEEKDENGNVTVVPAKTPLKIKYLLSMQSGLDYDLERPGIKRVLSEKGMQATTREIVDAFVETPLKFHPGTHFMYSLSHDVAAAIVEVVSQMKFSEYLKKNIWEPLGMRDTFFAKPMNNLDRVAEQYIFMDEKKGIVPMDKSCNYQLSECYESGGAGLISCTEDYAKLGDTLACGGTTKDGIQILKPETIDIIKTNLLCEQSLKDVVTTMGRLGYGYGCGMQILMHPELINSPAPAGVFGWDGAAGSCLIMDRSTNTSLVYTMHVRNCGMAYGVIHPRLRDFLFED